MVLYWSLNLFLLLFLVGNWLWRCNRLLRGLPCMFFLSRFASWLWCLFIYSYIYITTQMKQEKFEIDI